MKIEKLIKNLSGKAFDNSITSHTTRIPELKEQLKEAYCREQINLYQKLQEGAERSKFLKYLKRMG